MVFLPKDRAPKAYVGVDIAKLEIRKSVTIYQLCVPEEVTWNVTEH
jgi:hypothetical protein